MGSFRIGKPSTWAWSELIVRSGHGVIDNPDAIREVIRILHLEQRVKATRTSQTPIAVQQIQQHRSISLTELHFKLLEEFSPGSVLIDKDDNIVGCVATL